ncbi:MAG: ATP-binding protein [Nitrospirota bacterium]
MLIISNIPPVYPLYFFYGAAFIFLGIAIAVKDTKTSDLKLAGSLWLLGVFGFTHGIREWLELYPLIDGEHLTLQEIVQARLITVVFGIISFLFLLQFGLRLVRALEHGRSGWLKALPVILSFAWLFALWKHGFSMDMQFLRRADTAGRYLLGLPGGLLTAYGLIVYSYKIRTLSRFVSRKLFSAGIAFSSYSFFAGVVPSYSVLPLIPVPVEVLRGVSAVFIAYFIIKALNIFDIETKRKIEQQMRLIVQAEKLTSLGRLAAGIAHEINNPLTNASLGIQTLKSGLQSGGGKIDVLKRLDAVERNIDRAADIARELLQFSRQSEPKSVPVNINTVINGALTLLKHKLDNVVVERDLADLPAVTGEPGKLEQVFINVLSNAAEAMPGGGRISIVSCQQNGAVQARISDTGVGIPEMHLSRAFDPFFTTKDPGTGTGLGLSLCYGIIKQHDGTIEISSTPGKGTTVTIKIPIKERHEQNSRSR